MKDKQKQKLLEQRKQVRVQVSFNTGTRAHKSKKDYKREKNWRDEE